MLSQVGFEPEYKKENQDNCFAYDKYITSDQGLFAVMDGHGPYGHRVSDFVKRKLPEVFAECTMQFTDIKQALASTYLTVDRGLEIRRDVCPERGRGGLGPTHLS